MVAGMSRDEFVAQLVRAGELEVSGENQEEVDGYFSPDFTFHGPGGWEANYAAFTAYFRSWRHAFDNRKITRGIVIVEGDYIACQTTMEGDFGARVHAVTGRTAATQWATRRVRADQHLPLRR